MKDEEVGGNEGLGGNEGVDREQEGGQGDDVRRSEGEKARPAPEFAEMRTASLQPDKHLEQKERVMKAPAAGDAVTAFVKQVARNAGFGGALAHHLIDEYGPPRPSTILDNGPNTKKYITAEQDIAERRRWLRKHTARTPLGEPPELSDDAKSILITAEGLVLPIDPNALRLACGGLDDQRYQNALDELFVVEFMVIGGKIARQPKNSMPASRLLNSHALGEKAPGHERYDSGIGHGISHTLKDRVDWHLAEMKAEGFAGQDVEVIIAEVQMRLRLDGRELSREAVAEMLGGRRLTD